MSLISVFENIKVFLLLQITFPIVFSQDNHIFVIDSWRRILNFILSFFNQSNTLKIRRYNSFIFRLMNIIGWVDITSFYILFINIGVSHNKLVWRFNVWFIYIHHIDFLLGSSYPCCFIWSFMARVVVQSLFLLLSNVLWGTDVHFFTFF